MISRFINERHSRKAETAVKVATHARGWSQVRGSMEKTKNPNTVQSI